MRPLSLLFDPRGAIDRRTFWSGLVQLAFVSLIIGVGLSRLGSYAYPALLPGYGEAFVTWGAAQRLNGHSDVALTVSILLIAARDYVVACLVLKRSRHAGQGHGPLTAFALVGLAVHGLTGFWIFVLFPDDAMAAILPLFCDMAAGALVWAIFLIWIGTRDARFSPGKRKLHARPG